MSKLLTYKGFEGSAELDLDEQVCVGKILFIDDLVTYQAETPSDLVKEFQAAVDDYLETCSQLGRDPKKPFSGQFNVRVTPDQHGAAVRRGRADGISLNALIGRALESYLSKETTSFDRRRTPVTIQSMSNATLLSPVAVGPHQLTAINSKLATSFVLVEGRNNAATAMYVVTSDDDSQTRSATGFADGFVTPTFDPSYKGVGNAKH